MNRFSAADPVGPAGLTVIGEGNIVIYFVMADRAKRKAKVMNSVRNIQRQGIGCAAGRYSVAIGGDGSLIQVVYIDADIF